MTPRQFFRACQAAELRSQDRLRELTTQAWQTVRIYAEARGRKSGFPKLQKFLDEIGTSKGRGPQSARGMRVALELLAAATGTKVREVKAS